MLVICAINISNEKSGKGKRLSQNFSSRSYDKDLLILISAFLPRILNCGFKLKDFFAVGLVVRDLDYDCPILFIGGAKNLILDFLVLENF